MPKWNSAELPENVRRCIIFFVLGIPKGQPRPKAFARNMGGGKWAARVYDPGTAEEWKSQIAVAAKEHRPDKPIEGPVFFRMKAYFPRPKSHFRSNGELKPTAPKYVCTKPDFDNCEKAATDALTHLGFWRDDSQIVANYFVKQYVMPADREALVGANIEILELGNDELVP